MLRLILLLIVVMTNYLSVYAKDLELIKQDTIVPEIGLVVLNGDTLFTINRKMAEEIAIQYDSLEIVSKKLTDCREVVDSFISLQEKYQISIDKSIEINTHKRWQFAMRTTTNTEPSTTTQYDKPTIVGKKK